jgi:hypothetical protein
MREEDKSVQVERNTSNIYLFTETRKKHKTGRRRPPSSCPWPCMEMELSSLSSKLFSFSIKEKDTTRLIWKELARDVSGLQHFCNDEGRKLSRA